MAFIKKRGARKRLEETDHPSPSVANFPEDGGLTFRIHIGDHTVSLTHSERDMLIAYWEKALKDFEGR